MDLRDYLCEALLPQIASSPWIDTAYYFFNRHYSIPKCDLTAQDTFLEIAGEQLALICRRPCAKL